MKVDYAVRALLELADTHGAATKQSAEIAERWNIPAPYLDQLLTALRKAGLVTSVRGPQGGHALARPPSGITLSEVFEALEGSSTPIDCLDDSARCQFSRSCALQDVWVSVEKAVEDVLRSVSIADLSERQTALAGPAMYYI